MNNLKTIIIGLIITSLAIAGCKEAKELLYVYFSADYETEIDITIPPGTTVGGSFSIYDTIDPETNFDYSQYIDNITEVEIESLTAVFTSVSKNVTLNTCTFDVYNDNNLAKWEFTDVPIEVGTELELNNDNGQWDEMVDIMFGKVPFVVHVYGTVDEDNVTFTIMFNIETNITATPLGK